MTNEELVSELDRLTGLLTGGAGGWDDATTRNDFEATLFKMDGVLADPYGNGKIGSARTWVPTLFSARKHAQWGADKVRQFLLQDLSNARRTIR